MCDVTFGWGGNIRVNIWVRQSARGMGSDINWRDNQIHHCKYDKVWAKYSREQTKSISEMIFNLQHFIWHRLFYETLHASICVHFQMRNLTLCQLIPVNIKTVSIFCIFFFKYTCVYENCNSTQTSSSKLASTRPAWFLLTYEQPLGEIEINWKSLCLSRGALKAEVVK